MKLEDVTGKSLLAIEVFGLLIRALKSHLLGIMITSLVSSNSSSFYISRKKGLKVFNEIITLQWCKMSLHVYV
jgi:hypothetical protein